MNGFDVFVITLLALGGYRGYKSGFLIAIISLLAILLGLLAGFKLADSVVSYLQEKLEINPVVLPYIAFALVFLIVVILVSLLGKWMKSSIEKSFFGSVDQALGAILGIMKMTFMISIFLWLANGFIGSRIAWYENSLIYPYIAPVAPDVINWFGKLMPVFKNIL